MRLSRFTLFGLIAIGLVAPIAAQSASGTDSTFTTYHGFRIDTGRADARIDDDFPSLARQIAIVEGVDVPPAVTTFFRSIPIRVDAHVAKPPGEFLREGGRALVKILPDGLAPDRPILLHELLHAYHAGVVGLDDPTILAAYAQARASSDYPSRFGTAHFLENAREYFAVTSSIYLFGPVHQPPFDCHVVKATQPEYLALLAARFGPHDCR